MAVAYLNPAVASANNNWDSSTLSELAQGETSNTWQSNGTPVLLNVSLSDFDNTGVASIDSIRFVFRGYADHRVATFKFAATLANASSTSYYEPNIRTKFLDKEPCYSV